MFELEFCAKQFMRGNENANINFAVVVSGDPDSIVIFKKTNKK